ncbi:sensor domain-containing diguanylate cyclase [Candidatus Clostridium helianthi]|uniref:Diguanylate cyclase n=1 Tax=Candidatus Clostridium helianthi TaxID=3381660 RepID=A0ABW8SBH9_9CLOT
MKLYVKGIGFKSIRNAFIVPFIAPIVIALVFVTITLMNGSQRAVDSVLREMSQSMLQQVKIQLDNRFSEANKLNEIHIDSFKAGFLNLDDQSGRERYFVSLLKNFNDVAMTYVGLKDGSFYGARRTIDGNIQVVRNNKMTKGSSEYYSTSENGEGLFFVEKFDDFDPRTRPWYIKAVSNESSSFSDIYNHFVFKEPTITVSTPIYENNELIGVFGVDYLLTWLGKTLNSLPIGKSGQIFVVNSNNQLVASSSDEKIFKIEDGKSQLIKAEESENKIIRKTIELSENLPESKLINFDVNEEKYYANSESFEKNGVEWRIYIVLSEADFLSEMNYTIRKTEMFNILFILLFLVFGFWIARRITKPIVNLNASAKALTEGTFKYVDHENRQDELGQLTKSFNIMGSQLTGLVANLEMQVAERTRELEERNEFLQELSFFDGLTGIPNRRRFDEFFNKAFSSSIRNSKPIAILMLDVDEFKKYNDTYGHLKGDECIKNVAAVLKNTIKRKSDMAARYGGEEFIVLLQDTDKDSIIKISKEIMRGIKDLNMEHVESIYGVVTVSIGIVYDIPNKNQNSAEFIAKADEALYYSKNNGKNRVEFAKNQ